MTRARRLVLVLVAAAFAAGCRPAEDSEIGGGRAPSAAPAETEAGAEADRGPRLTGRAPEAEGGIPAVVVLSPADPDAPSTLPDSVTLDQFGLAFNPRITLVAAGGTLVFTNSEGALTHNVHLRAITDGSTVLDTDTAPGERAEARNLAAGGYDVLCSMHPGMTAFVFATEAAYAASAAPNGTFDMAAPPPGAYAVRVWTAADGYSAERRIVLEEGGASLDLTGLHVRSAQPSPRGG